MLPLSAVADVARVVDPTPFPGVLLASEVEAARVLYEKNLGCNEVPPPLPPGSTDAGARAARSFAASYCRELGQREFARPAGGPPISALAVLLRQQVDRGSLLTGRILRPCWGFLQSKYPERGASKDHVWVVLYAAPANPADDPEKAPPVAWCGY